MQRAFDPLIQDPRIDRAMDLAPFRARRVLFSWTAYLLGLGRPVWIVNVYALQNVACWLMIAVLLTRWVPLTSGRGLALWAACLFSHGFLWSVRFSLLDGPSPLLTACAVAAAERGRTLLSACIVGVWALERSRDERWRSPAIAGKGHRRPEDQEVFSSQNSARIWNVPHIYITENGCSSSDVPAADRVMYLRNDLAQLH